MKTAFKFLYCLLAIILTMIVIFDYHQHGFYKPMVSILIPFVALIVSVIVGGIQLYSFCGACLSTVLIYWVWEGDGAVNYLLIGFWFISILLLLYSGYKKRNRQWLIEEIIHLLGYALLVVFAYQLFSLSDQIVFFVNATEGDFDLENRLRVPLKLLSLLLISLYFSKSISGYILSFATAFSIWRIIRYVPGTGEKANFYDWAVVKYHPEETTRITESVDMVLKLGIAVILFIGVMIIIRGLCMALSLNKESQAVKETPFERLKRKLLSKINSERFKEKQTKILKILLLFVTIVGVMLALFIIFDIKDRVNISMNGLEAYDFSEYDEKSEVIADIKFEYNTYSPIDFFNGDAIELYNDGKRTVSICEHSNTLTYFSLYILSEGYGNYEEGSYVSLSYIEPAIIETAQGDLIMELIDVTEFKNNSVMYEFKFYPEEEMSHEQFQNLDISGAFSGVELISFQRK